MFEIIRMNVRESNQVIGEAYIAVQHHYGVTKADARTALTDVLQSGLVAPLNGRSVFAALEATGGCGLLDRLIADDYHRAGLVTLTVDRKMAALQNSSRNLNGIHHHLCPESRTPIALLISSRDPGHLFRFGVQEKTLCSLHNARWLVGLRGSRGNSTNMGVKSRRVLDTSKSSVGSSALYPQPSTGITPIPMPSP